VGWLLPGFARVTASREGLSAPSLKPPVQLPRLYAVDQTRKRGTAERELTAVRALGVTNAYGHIELCEFNT
jgi:hypothetical protein